MYAAGCVSWALSIALCQGFLSLICLGHTIYLPSFLTHSVHAPSCTALLSVHSFPKVSRRNNLPSSRLSYVLYHD